MANVNVKTSKFMLVFGAFLMTLTLAVGAVDTAQAAKCLPTRKASWGAGRVCAQSSDSHFVKVDTNKKNTCVEARVYDEQKHKWTRQYNDIGSLAPKSCGTPATGSVGTGSARGHGIRLYNLNTKRYITLCDGPEEPVREVGSCLSLERR